MSMNVVILQGRFPASDKFDFKYIQGEEGGKRSYFRGTLSVDQNFVQKGQKYPDSDLINIRAFGQVADRIAKFFRPGDNILINGQLRHDKPYHILSVTVENKPGVLSRVTGWSDTSGQSLCYRR